MRQQHRGFTLIEAVIAVAVSGICLGVAIPSLTGAISAAHAGSAKSAMVETFTRALTHSTVTGAEVVVCPSTGDACVDTTDWSMGWIAFADLDGNRSRGPGDTPLMHQAALANGVHLRGTTGRKLIVFKPTGAAAAGSNATLTLCDRRGPAKASALILANNGRFRVGEADPSAAVACMQPL